MSRILVTGAAGFIGSHLCDRLTAEGHKVFGVDNLQTGRRQNLPEPCDWFWQGDIAAKDFSGWAAGFEPDTIIHCAASYDDRDKWHRDTNTNVNGSINVGIAARACGARVVYFQTALVYGNNPYKDALAGPNWTGPVPNPVSLGIDTPVAPENSYAISKYAGEQYLRHADIPLLVLRLANIYGPRNLSGPLPTFYKRLTEGDQCTIVDSRRDFVYINDLVDLVERAITKEAVGTYHVSTGRDYSIGELYECVVDELGLHGSSNPTLVERGADDAPTILLDPSATKGDFGWQATTDLDEGVSEAVAFYRENGVSDVYTHLKMKG